MTKPKQRSVRILNPASGCGYTSHRRAAEYVRQKRAVWQGSAIRFLTADPRHQAVQVSAQSDYDRAANSGCASIDAIRNLPMVGDVLRILMRRERAA